MLVIGGFILATPGGGIMTISHIEITALAAAILLPTLVVSFLLMRVK